LFHFPVVPNKNFHLIMSSWNWQAQDSTKTSEKLWNAAFVGGATAAASYLLPINDKKWYLDFLNITPGGQGIGVDPRIFMGVVGAGTSLAADFFHDMIYHNLGLPASLEGGSDYLLRLLLGGVGGTGVMYLANPQLAKEIPMWIPATAGAMGELGGIWAARKLNSMSNK
jgi:hypothetical protein